jgi:hypothetical protein
LLSSRDPKKDTPIPPQSMAAVDLLDPETVELCRGKLPEMV